MLLTKNMKVPKFEKYEGAFGQVALPCCFQETINKLNKQPILESKTHRLGPGILTKSPSS